MTAAVALTHCRSAVMNAFLISFADYLLSMHTAEDRIGSRGPLVETLEASGGGGRRALIIFFYFSLLTCSSVYIEIMLLFLGAAKRPEPWVFLHTLVLLQSNKTSAKGARSYTETPIHSPLISL